MKKTAIYQTKRANSSWWMNKWFQSPKWLAGFGAAVAVSLILFAVNALTGTVRPSSTWGIGYGIASAVAFVFVFVYSVRRRTMKFRRSGRAWTYLQIHVYGGGLFILLMLMHTAFSLPQGVNTWWLWALSFWVVGSGLFGIAVQKWIPTVLNTAFSVEVHYDRVPELVDHIRGRSEKLVASSHERLQDFYSEHLAPSLISPEPRMMYFFDVTGGINNRVKQFSFLRRLLPAADQEALDELQRLYRSKLEIDAHYTLQKGLRGWLKLHVPVSIVLVVLLGLHIFSVLYY